MSKRKFYWIIAFSVVPSFTNGLKEFLEEKHFPRLAKTGLFFSFMEMPTNSSEGRDHIIYIIELQNERDWTAYENTLRPDSRKDFFEEFKSPIKTGKILVTMSQGYLKDMKLVWDKTSSPV
ncbi:hypothetical protein H6776_01520 [Candidatus Nomurabacteria bacterium]|nr:hypothetical protein [Candidatus Nomurabacteria bacterium]